MGKNTAALKNRALVLSPEEHVVLTFDAGLRAGDQREMVTLDARFSPSNVVVTYARYAAGKDATKPEARRTLTLSGTWRRDIEAVVANTRLVDRLHLVDGPTWKLHINPEDGAPAPKSRAQKPAPCMPSNLDEWQELTEALGALVEDRLAPCLRFMHVEARRVTEMRIYHHLHTRTASISYLVDGGEIAHNTLPLDQYKEVVSVLRGLRAAGATFPGDPPVKQGFYVDTGSGDLSAWSRDVINPNGPRARTFVERVRKLQADKRPQDFPEWVPEL